MTSLGRRLATAALLIPVVVGGVLGLPTSLLGVLFGAIILGSAWEWSGLMGWTSAVGRWIYTFAVIPVLYIAERVADVPAGLYLLLGASLLWWMVTVGWVVRFQRGVEVRALAVLTAGNAKLLSSVAGWLVLVPAWIALTFIHDHHQHGPYLVMAFLVLIWIADSGAYFVGRRWGVTKLAPRVSPGKSWEGVAGACVAASVFAVFAGAYLGLPKAQLLPFVILCLATVFVSILGDLVESLIKRHAGVKDSGRLLPGHGGLLDRIDSLTAAGPFFVLGLEGLRILHG